MTFFIKSFYSVRKLFLPCFFEAGVYCIDYVVVEYEFRFGGRGDFAQKIAFYRVLVVSMPNPNSCKSILRVVTSSKKVVKDGMQHPLSILEICWSLKSTISASSDCVSPSFLRYDFTVFPMNALSSNFIISIF